MDNLSFVVGMIVGAFVCWSGMAAQKLLEWLDERREQRKAIALMNRKFEPPPPGWFMFGTHAYPGGPKVELSREVGRDGMPLWERPIEAEEESEAR